MDDRDYDVINRKIPYDINMVFDTMLKTSPCAIVMINERSQILEWSTKSEEMFGYSRDEAMGKSLADLIIPAHLRERHYKGLKKFVDTGEKTLLDKGPVAISAINKNGKEIPVKLSLTCYPQNDDASEKGYVFLGYIQDVSSEHKLQNAFDDLSRTYSDLQDLLEKLPASIAVFDPDDWNPILVNNAFRNLLSTTKFGRDFSLTEIMEMVGMIPVLDNIAKSGTPLHISRYTGNDGRKYDADLIPITLREKSHILMFLLDITQKVKDEEEKTDLQVREQSALEKSKLKSDFLSNLSHEIRTPINGIYGMTELLVRTPLNAEQKDYLENIQNSAEILRYTVDAILDISRLESGKLEVSKDCVNINEVFKELNTVYGFAAKEKKLEFAINVADAALNNLEFTTDKSKLIQILSNLMGNAVKFTHTGSVKLNISHNAKNEDTKNEKDKDGEKLQIKFDVIDTGIGISEESKSQLFKPFTQLAEFSTKRYTGTGLGLYLSQKLAYLLDESKISAESTFGKGSTFTLLLNTTRCSKPAPKPVSIDKQMVLLVAEDNLINQRLIVKFLKDAGHMVKSVFNGLEAVEEMKINGDKYDVILMDIQMPEMNGYESTKEIRKLHYDLPIIAVTANAEPGEKEKCLSMGMNDYLSKPYKRQSLLDKISIWG